MNENKKDIGILEMMAKNEKAISELYKTYSVKFQEYRDFWLGLSAQETEHATWIYDLGEKVKDGSVLFNENRFDVNTIEKFYDCVDNMLNVAREKEISLEDALSNALTLEDNLVENKFFEVFESDAEELKIVMKLLYSSTNDHRRRVQNALDNIKR